jgi:hypothetical protein
MPSRTAAGEPEQSMNASASAYSEQACSARRHRVADDDLRGTGREGHESDHSTDRPSTGDRDARPHRYLRLATGPESDRERLAEGAGVIGDLVGQPEREVLVDAHVAGERAVNRRRGEEDHVPAEVVVAGTALPTGATRHARLEGYSLSELVSPRELPPADDGSRGLVAEHHWCGYNEVADPAVLVVVDI